MKKKAFFFVCFLALVGIFVYRQQTRPQYAKIPLSYKPYSTVPVVEMEIESNKYLIELDLGFSDCLTLREEILNKLTQKQEEESVSFLDIHGNRYMKPQFLIPEVKIANFRAHPVPVAQENMQFLLNAYLGDGDTEISKKRAESVEGRLGVKIFEKACLLVDLHHSVLYIARNARMLPSECDSLLSEFVEVPSDPLSEGAIFVLSTDKGEKKFLIDSGTELSLWHDPDPVHRYQFVPTTFFPKEAAQDEHMLVAANLQSFGVDGILGVDFLKKHVVLIDLPNRRALISAKSDNL